MDPQSYQYKQIYYYYLRLMARKAVTDDFIARFKKEGGKDNWNMMVLGSIDETAVQYADQIWPGYRSVNNFRGFPFTWDTLWRRYRGRPSNFDLAIWQHVGADMVLQGMALGKVSRGKKYLTLHWIERSFAPTYLRGGILLPVLGCAEEYAKRMGCSQVRIKNPIDPSVYLRYGYSEFKPPEKAVGIYLGKDVSHV